MKCPSCKDGLTCAMCLDGQLDEARSEARQEGRREALAGLRCYECRGRFLDGDQACCVDCAEIVSERARQEAANDVRKEMDPLQDVRDWTDRQRVLGRLHGDGAQTIAELVQHLEDIAR